MPDGGGGKGNACSVSSPSVTFGDTSPWRGRIEQRQRAGGSSDTGPTTPKRPSAAASTTSTIWRTPPPAGNAASSGPASAPAFDASRRPSTHSSAPRDRGEADRAALRTDPPPRRHASPIEPPATLRRSLDRRAAPHERPAVIVPIDRRQRRIGPRSERRRATPLARSPARHSVTATCARGAIAARSITSRAGFNPGAVAVITIRPRPVPACTITCASPLNNDRASALLRLVAVGIAVADADDRRAVDRELRRQVRGRHVTPVRIDRIDRDRLRVLAVARHHASASGVSRSATGAPAVSCAGRRDDLAAAHRRSPRSVPARTAPATRCPSIRSTACSPTLRPLSRSSTALGVGHHHHLDRLALAARPVPVRRRG